MRFDIITLFPELFGPFLEAGVTQAQIDHLIAQGRANSGDAPAQVDTFVQAIATLTARQAAHILGAAQLQVDALDAPEVVEMTSVVDEVQRALLAAVQPLSPIGGAHDTVSTFDALGRVLAAEYNSVTPENAMTVKTAFNVIKKIDREKTAKFLTSSAIR